MKKLSLLTLMMIATAGLVFAQSIRVDSPVKGETVIKGTTYTIKWTLTGKQDTAVKINIFKNSIAVSNFVEQLTGPNSGSMKWNVKNSYADGNYAIRIKTTDNKVVGDSGIFRIIKGVDPNISKHDPDINKHPSISNTVQILPGIAAPNVLNKIEVIKRFDAVNPKIETGRYVILAYEYLNARSARIENAKTGKVLKELGTDSKGKGTHIEYPDESTTYRLVINSSLGRITKETSVTVEPVLLIELFAVADSSQRNPVPGQDIELFYLFKGAEYAAIYEYRGNKLITEIPINGKYRVDGIYKLKYTQPTIYKLIISRNNGNKFLKKDLQIPY